MSISGERTGGGGGVTGGRPGDTEATSCCHRVDCAGPSDIVPKGVVLQTSVVGALNGAAGDGRGFDLAPLPGR